VTQDPRIDRLEGAVEQMGERVGSLENSMNSRFSAQDSRFNSLENRMVQLFLGLLGFQIASFVVLFVAILLKD
jgi:hypothetical protein